MNPKVSVIIPVYNTASYVGRAIESVLQQTEVNFEIICVDDASTDSSVEVIGRFNDDRIKLFSNKINMGQSYSRNRALHEANGDWIAILDSDDWFEKTRLEILLGLAERKNLDIIADDIYFIKENDNSPWGTQLSSHGIKMYDIFLVNIGLFVELDIGIKPIIRRKFIIDNSIQYNENLRFGEDHLILLECLISGAKFSIYPYPFYFYRSRKDSMIKDKLNLLEKSREVTLSLLDLYKFIDNKDLIIGLNNRLVKIESAIEYYRVVVPFKKWMILKGLNELIRSPKFFIHLAIALPKIVKHRFLSSFKFIKTV